MSRDYLRKGGILFALLTFSLSSLTLSGVGAPPSLAEMFEERTQSVVAVEFFVEAETDRRPSVVVGLVIDDDGTILLLDSAIPGWLPPDQLKDFQVYAPGSRDGVSGEYLGQDQLTGWHYLRVVEDLPTEITPCTAYPTVEPEIGTEAWGIALMGKDFDFQPYLMQGRVALIQKIPQEMGFSVTDVASPGAPVFSAQGDFLGWAENPIWKERQVYLENERYNVSIRNPNGSGSFLLAKELLPYLDRIPESVTGQSVPWLGVVGMQPVEREAAKFLKIENVSAILISDIVKDGPAAGAGMLKRDIILTIDGEEMPKFSPQRAVINHFEREILRREPGDTMQVGILRGTDERLDISVTLGTQPTPLKEADRKYFERLGITLREMVLFDQISRQISDSEETGVIANFVKPNTPANTAGLRAGDLVREIDGMVIENYEQAVEAMQAIEENESLTEFVLLISRGTETSVIRVRLN